MLGKKWWGKLFFLYIFVSHMAYRFRESVRLDCAMRFSALSMNTIESSAGRLLAWAAVMSAHCHIVTKDGWQLMVDVSRSMCDSNPPPRHDIH